MGSHPRTSPLVSVLWEITDLRRCIGTNRPTTYKAHQKGKYKIRLNLGRFNFVSRETEQPQQTFVFTNNAGRKTSPGAGDAILTQPTKRNIIVLLH